MREIHVECVEYVESIDWHNLGHNKLLEEEELSFNLKKNINKCDEY